MKPHEIQLFKEVIAETCERFGLDEFVITVSKTDKNGDGVIYNLSNTSKDKETHISTISKAVYNALLRWKK
ncbi:hypothetical protein [Emticicia sp. W12TSBA100-4]|uniref:hypothetical protein n=1 Tax=Emticicia sp. W12TSBA100-4 TaxID=3160965 RepID=UPI0033062220